MKKIISSRLGYLLTLAIVATAAIGLMIVGLNSNKAEAQATSTQSLCTSRANQLKGVGIVSGNVCDVVIVRDSPTIKGHDGRNLNVFTLMNSVIEFGPAQSGNNVYVMGDFALLETELNDVLRLMTDYNWTVTGIHNHMIMEEPKTTFIHWEAVGNPDTIISQIQQAINRTSIKKFPATPTPTPPATSTPATSSPTLPGTGGTATGTITLTITKHMCPKSVRNVEDYNALGNFDQKMINCPVVVSGSDTPTTGTITGGTSTVSFTLRARSTSGMTETLNVEPTFAQNRVCQTHTGTATSTTGTTTGMATTTTTCYDASHYVWKNLPATDITITENMPRGTRFAAVEFSGTSTNDSNSLISAGDGIINLNTRNISDNRIDLHVFNLRSTDTTGGTAIANFFRSISNRLQEIIRSINMQSEAN